MLGRQYHLPEPKLWYRFLLFHPERFLLFNIYLLLLCGRRWHVVRIWPQPQHLLFNRLHTNTPLWCVHSSIKKQSVRVCRFLELPSRLLQE